MNDKVNYVKSQPQSRKHTCHWAGCNTQVPPAMWGCTKHWYMLPRELRSKIWAAYRTGQEKDMRPSESYLKVAQEVQDWITAQKE